MPHSKTHSDDDLQGQATAALDSGNQSTDQTMNGNAATSTTPSLEKQIPPLNQNDGQPAQSATVDSSQDDSLETKVEYPGALRLLTVITALVLALLLAVMDLIILATAIPHITDEFHSLGDIGWYASAYFVTVAATQSTWGKAFKYFDLKSVFLITIAIFELGSLICGVARNSSTLIVGRAITGVGAAGIIAGCYIIVAFSVKPERRPAFASVLAVTYGIGSSIAPVIGGVLADRVSWRWCFFINLPVGAVSVIIIAFTFKTPAISRNDQDIGQPLKEKVLQMDLPGTLVIVAATVSLLLALQWGGVTKSWKSADVIGLIIGFVLISILFGAIEYYQGDRAVLVPHIMKKRVVRVGSLVSFFLGGGEYTLLYYIPIYFQSVLGTSAEQSGVRNLAFIIPVTLSTVAAGAAVSSTGHFAPLIVFGAAVTTVGSGLMYTWSVYSSANAWIGYQVLAGVGIGLCFQTPIMVAQALSSAEDVAATTAIVLFFQTLAGAFLVPSAQAAFTNILIARLKVHVPAVDPSAVIAVGATKLREIFTDPVELAGVIDSYMDGLRVVFALVAALCGAATIASLAMPWTSIKKQKAGVSLGGEVF
ncbi:major facilitator superfamily domain-containing protein [Nemania sp. NC0429]|nr:major facilitator superfamily domain-containing protein [Nemania sp. NC0429]